MTVLLIGVEADSTNTRPTPPVYPGSRFEYVPILGRQETTKSINMEHNLVKYIHVWPTLIDETLLK
jgi:hypothetical protein